MQISPLVSVVMSVYNGDLYLREAIESILNQTYTNFEFIIINDGSIDKSSEIIKEYSDPRIKLIEHENQGLARSLNKGIRMSNGEYIARMDSDDISFPTRLDKQVHFLLDNPDYVVVGSKAIIIEKGGAEIFYHESYTAWEDIKTRLIKNPIFHSSAMFRKEIAKKVGYYNEDIKNRFEDVILWNQLSKYGKICNLNEYLIKYRLTPNAITLKSGKETMVMHEISKNMIMRGYSTEDERLLLKKTVKKISKRYQLMIYYFHVGKKYLLNANKKLKALSFFFKVITMFPSFFKVYPYIALCLIPSKLLNKIYKSRM